jgi:hypothetical protein
MAFVELKPEVVFAALEGHKNILVGEQEKMDAYYRQFICPSCKSPSLSKRFIPGHAYSDPSYTLARATLLCNECKCHFDPHSGLILEVGNPARVSPHIPIIGSSSSSSGP